MKIEKLMKAIEGLTISEMTELAKCISLNLERSQKCGYFDGVTCNNSLEFPYGSPNVVHSDYCNYSCIHHGIDES